jgi:PAS domain S-box-containing protein
MLGWIQGHSQFLLLAAGCLLGFGAQYGWSRGKVQVAHPWLVWVLAGLVLGLGWRLSEQAAAHEERQIQTVTEGFARLYAHQMEELGHWRLESTAGPSDPLYLSMIDAETQWLAINPAINDIYTLRKRSDGENAFLVDSETDYNRNGKYDEERELRTPIGEVFDTADAGLEAAFHGQANFEFVPITDRWGTWLSAYVPMYNPEGRLDGVLGVDFEAAEFAGRVAAAKTRVLSLVALVEAILLAASLFVGVMHARAAERQRAEVALWESEERFANAFQYAAIGMALVAPDGRWLKVNRALCRLVGYCSAELLTATFQDITHPDDVDADLEHVHQLLAGEKDSYQMEKRYLHKHGHEVLVLLSVSLVRDSEGKPLHFISQIQDITEQRCAEWDLRENERRFRELIQTLPAAIYTCDVRGRITLYNQSAVAMWGREPVLGKDHWCGSWRIYDSDEEPVALEDSPMAQTLRTGVPIRGREIVIERPDGSRVHVLAHPDPIRDADGRVIGAVNMLVDITYRKEAEAELQKIHRELLETSRQAGMAEVATSVLHNVGNVLNSVNVSATLAMDVVRRSKAASLGKLVGLLDAHAADLGAFVTGDPKGRRVPEYLRQLHDRLGQEQKAVGKELSALTKNIEHIKDIVAMQQSYGKVSGLRETLSVTDLIEDSLRLNSSSLARHEIEVVREFQPVPPICVEKHKILQILVNLIRNAKHACDEAESNPKRLTLRVANEDGRIKISVSDNGIGIGPENLARIFSHGFTTKKNGHGFGLHSGALAAQEMGGELRVVSEGAGQGATFTLELPVGPTA